MSASIPCAEILVRPSCVGEEDERRPQARRLLALAAIYDGATRTEAAMIGGVGFRSSEIGCCTSTSGALTVC